VCIYNRMSWDARCVGSLFHHSAFGFAYAWPQFFVCISGLIDLSAQLRLARSVGWIVKLLAGMTSLSPIVAHAIQTIAEQMELAVRNATSFRSAALKLQLALTNLDHSPVR